jgi:hypothetical protein
MSKFKIILSCCLGKPVHRRDAEFAEKTQRKEMKRITKKEKRIREEEEEERTLSSSSSLRFLCEFCVSAVNWLSIVSRVISHQWDHAIPEPHAWRAATGQVLLQS